MGQRKKGGTTAYGAEDITVLEGLEPVRRRPGMYIGTTGPEGLQHLVIEVFENARDEAMAGHASRVEITLLPDGYVRVADDGRGIPVDVHKQTKVSALETIMTTLHAGGKFGGGGYKVSGGLHGVGVSVVNALSETARAEVHRDGTIYVQEYERGVAKQKVKKTGSSKYTGTIITSKPDARIFKEIAYNRDMLISYLRQQAYLTKAFRITLIDARETETPDSKELFFLEEEDFEAPRNTFYFEGGLASMVKHYNEPFKPVHRSVFHAERAFELPAEETNREVDVEISFQYVDDISSRELAFANNTYNPEGGTHLTGFRTALTRTLNDYARKNNMLKAGDDALSGDDAREGLTAVISVKLAEVQFEGQTKSKLGSVEARSAVEKVLSESLSEFLEEHPDDARAIVNKVILAFKARKAAKAAKESVLRKGALEGFTLPGKLADCQSRDLEESEIFIVEGDSAGGSSKMARDRRTQAILPLRGKILNVERARLDRMLSSNEIKALVVALGTAIGDTFNEEKLRYGKIIIATDADVDGAHIRTLLLTLFFRYFTPLIESGRIYIATPPLYKIKKGKTARYAYTEDEKVRIVKEFGGDDEDARTVEPGEDHSDEETDGGERRETEDESVAKTKKGGSKILVQRYKGLGEMNPDELWETTMNPETRVLKNVTVDDAREADRVFDILMGTDVPSRKSFIQTHAKEADVDI